MNVFDVFHVKAKSVSNIWINPTFLLLSWGVAILTGFAVLAAHSFNPGAPARPRVDLLGSSETITGHPVSTLLMFLHPECPCSQASVEELNRLMARCQGRLVAHVFIFQPSNQSEAWSRGSLWQTAEQIPGVTVTFDRDAASAKSSGAQTSGQVFLYDVRGQLQFSGGITESRGHAGDNDGADAVIDHAFGRESSVDRTPVFGCALFSQPNTGGAAR